MIPRANFVRISLILSVTAGLLYAVIESGSVDAQTRRSSAALESVKQLPPSGKRYALIVGVGQYDDSRIYSLKAPSNDAIMLAEALKRFAGFPEENIVLLATDNPREMQPTRNIIIDYLSNLTRLAGSDGLFLLAFAGHGYEVDGQAFLLGQDARLSTDMRVLRDTAVSWTGIMEAVEAAGVRQVMMLLDACRSDPRSGRSTPKPNRVTQIFARGLRVVEGPDTRNAGPTAMAKMLAAQEGEEAFEDVNKRQGFFMAAVVEGLRGAAANPDGRVTLGSLIEYVKETVPKRVAIQGLKQVPVEEIVLYDPALVIAEVPPDPATRRQTNVSLFFITNALEGNILIKSPDGKFNKSGRIEKGKFNLEISPGSYEVSVTADKYQPYAGKFTVEQGEAVDFQRIDLISTTGAITLVGSFEPNVGVLVDGRSYPFVTRTANEIQLKDVPVGTATVRVTQPDAEPWEEVIEVRSGDTTARSVLLRRRLVSLTVKSEPGALIYVDGVLKDQVTERGRTRIIEVEPGPRTIRAVGANFEPAEKVQAFAVGATEIELPLVRKPEPVGPVVRPRETVPFIVRTNVPTANVVVRDRGGADRARGRSENGEFRAELAPGTYRYEVVADRHQPFNGNVTINEGQVVSFVPVDLVPTSGSISLIGSFEPDAVVTVDGRRPSPGQLTITQREIQLKDLATGTRTVQIAQATFAIPWEEKVEVRGGMTIPVPVLYRPAVVNLRVKSEPGAEIYINDTYRGRVTEGGETGILEIPPGEHRIRAVKAEYNATEETRVFEPGDAALELGLTRIAFSAEFSDAFIEGLKFWTAPRGWSVENGRMTVRGSGIGLLRELVYKDFRMEIDISFANRRGAAWIVRATDDRNYYLFHLSGPRGSNPNTFRSYLCQNGELKLLKTDRVVEDLGRPDEKFHIIVEAKGSTISHWIHIRSAPRSEGPQPLSAMTDNSISYGTAGFTTLSDEETTVYFINVTPLK